MLPNSIVFQMTNLCDKKCKTCCAEMRRSKPYDKLNFSDLTKICNVLVKSYEKQDCPNFNFTGGEIFLYRDGLFDIIDCIDLIYSFFSKTNITLKTAGWEKHSVLDQRCLSILKKYKNVSIRLGLSPYQFSSKDSMINRYKNILSLIKEYQKRIIIEMIYDRNNLNNVLTFITNITGETKFIQKINEIPNLRRDLKFTLNNIEHIIRLSPAYPIFLSEKETFFKLEGKNCDFQKSKRIPAIVIESNKMIKFCDEPYASNNKSLCIFPETATELSDLFNKWQLNFQNIKRELSIETRLSLCKNCMKNVLEELCVL